MRLVFICAMWLTGFDAPSCSTVYLDKPIRNHTLMQTIARANRVPPASTAAAGAPCNAINSSKTASTRRSTLGAGSFRRILGKRSPGRDRVGNSPHLPPWSSGRLRGGEWSLPLELRPELDGVLQACESWPQTGQRVGRESRVVFRVLGHVSTEPVPQ